MYDDYNVSAIRIHVHGGAAVVWMSFISPDKEWSKTVNLTIDKAVFLGGGYAANLLAQAREAINAGGGVTLRLYDRSGA